MKINYYITIHFNLPSSSTKWYILVDHTVHGCHAFRGIVFLLLLSLSKFYRPPMKLGEGNALSCVCLFVTLSVHSSYYYSAS